MQKCNTCNTLNAQFRCVCRMKFYCNEKCQRNDWSIHSKECPKKFIAEKAKTIKNVFFHHFQIGNGLKNMNGAFEDLRKDIASTSTQTFKSILINNIETKDVGIDFATHSIDFLQQYCTNDMSATALITLTSEDYIFILSVCNLTLQEVMNNTQYLTDNAAVVIVNNKNHV